MMIKLLLNPISLCNSPENLLCEINCTYNTKELLLITILLITADVSILYYPTENYPHRFIISLLTIVIIHVRMWAITFSQLSVCLFACY